MKLIVLVQILSLGSVLANHPATEAEKAVWSSIGTFGHRLSQKLSSRNPHGNSLISPLSVATALSVTLTGAGGSTREEMLHAMHLQGVPPEYIARAFSSVLNQSRENATVAPASVHSSSKHDEVLTLLGANRLYLSNKFKIRDEFKAEVERNFHAETLSVDFVNDALKITADVNHFVEERTRGLIKDILKQPLNRGTMMTIINTLYFKGFWSTRMADKEVPTVFNAGCGQLQSEHSKRIAVISRFKYLDSDALQAQMILLPYISGSSAAAEMLILLPRTEHNCKTQSWLSQISWDNIKAEVRKMKKVRVNLEMPEFRIGGRYSLEEVLPALGMSLAFTPGKANFTGISNHQLNIDQVIHQVEMIVNKFGTEAAAATVITVNRLAVISNEEPVPFNVNRSFYLSVIYRAAHNDDALLPLFTGVVNKV